MKGWLWGLLPVAVILFLLTGCEGGGRIETWREGDMTIYGQRNNVKLIRTALDGEKEVHELDFTDANILNSPYYYMQQQDILYVEPNDVKKQNAEVGQTTTLWFRGVSIFVSIGSLLYNILTD